MQTHPAGPDGLHANSVISDDVHIHLDMDAVVKTATTATHDYKLTYDSQGKPFIWQGKATSPGHANAKARHELFFAEPLFSRYKSKLVSCVVEIES